MMQLKTRRYIYGIALAGVPILIAYGAVSGEHAALWVAMAGAVLVPGLSLANPTDDDGGSHERGRRAARSTAQAGNDGVDFVPTDKD